MSLSVLLVVLLWSLVEVHSQTEYPYVSFMGKNLPNHSYVGNNKSDPGNVVRCYTDLGSCCGYIQGIHRGDWYFPDGDRLPLGFYSDHNNIIYESRSAQQVALRRRGDYAILPSGMYRCDIPTVAVHDDVDTSVRETVYVGLYPPMASQGNC